jgi:putative membrane protein
VKNNHERMTMSSPSDILMHLHAANLEEIDAGQMAMKEGGPRAQDFGRMLVDDHRDADKKVKDLASKLGVKLDDTMGRMKMKDAHAKLEGKSGADFDKTFASAMIDGHKHVIDMVKSARASCKDRDVCNLLDEMLPTLQKHLRAAEDLKAPAAQGRTPEKR